MHLGCYNVKNLGNIGDREGQEERLCLKKTVYRRE